MVLVCVGWSRCISCGVGESVVPSGGGVSLKVAISCCAWCECVNLSQAFDSHQEMLVLCLVSPNLSIYCVNRVGVCSKNCLICSFIGFHSWGDLWLAGCSDPLVAIVKTMSSFVITSAVRSLGNACGSCAGGLRMAWGNACSSIPWLMRRWFSILFVVVSFLSQNMTTGLSCVSLSSCVLICS